MPGYNPWDAFSQGMDIGEDMRASANRRRIGDAYTEAEAQQPGSGLGAVERTAYGQGDLQTGMRTRNFQDDQRQGAYERMQTIAPWARNVLRAARTRDPESARSFLEQNQQRFIDFGIPAQNVASGIARLTDPDPQVREQAYTEFEAAFRQHEDPNWQLVGNQAVAVDQQSGDIQLGGRVPDSVGAGGRYLSPDEIAQAGYRPGSVVWVAPGEPPRVIQAPNAGRSPNAPGQYPDDGYDYHD